MRNPWKKNTKRGSAGTWVLGCLGVMVILIAVGIVAGIYLWNTYARPSMATASPDDIRYFLDDMLTERRMGKFPHKLFITLGGEEVEATLILDSMPSECVVTFHGPAEKPEMRAAVLAFAARHDSVSDIGNPDHLNAAMISVDLDASFEPNMRELAQSLAAYSNSDTWTYTWFGSFVLPDHIEVTDGPFSVSVPPSPTAEPSTVADDDADTVSP